MAKKLAILTGGADGPGLNAAIRAVVHRAVQAYGMEVVGVLRGWRGLMDGLFMPLDEQSVSGILPRGGTILRISRTNPYRHPDGPERIMGHIARMGIDSLVVVGGNETLSVAHRLHQEKDLPLVGVPKTIDNDVPGTDYSFGFDTTVNIATEAIDRIHTTAESHDRVMVLELMGHHAGWIAVYAGIAGGADAILIPEMCVSIDAVCETIVSRHERGRDFSIVVVAEGACFVSDNHPEGERIHQDSETDEFDEVRLGGVGAVLGRVIEERTGYETRVTILGHIQRGGTPTAADRVLATRFGIAAVDLAHQGKFGKMVCLQGSHIGSVDLAVAADGIKTVPQEIYEVAKAFFG